MTKFSKIYDYKICGLKVQNQKLKSEKGIIKLLSTEIYQYKMSDCELV